jgi:MFS family permease
MIATTLGMAPVRVMSAPRSLLDIKPVFRNRTALGYVLGYGAHCFELYGLRTWVVTFWTYIAARSGGMAVLAPITVSVIVAVLAMPASILGNEAALRFGRQRVIVCNMCLAGITATTIALSLGTSPEILLLLLLLYSITIPADSGALTSGMSASAQPAYRGATMALHSTVGFGLSAAGGWAVGAVLDIGGGMNVPLGWILAFLVMGGGGMLGPAALWWSRRPLASGYVSATGRHDEPEARAKTLRLLSLAGGSASADIVELSAASSFTECIAGCIIRSIDRALLRFPFKPSALLRVIGGWGGSQKCLIFLVFSSLTDFYPRAYPRGVT